MEDVKTERRNGVFNVFKTTFQTYQLCFDIFHGLCQQQLISLEWGFKRHSRLISSVLTSSMAYVKTELISLEWGFKHIPDLFRRSVLTSSMAYVKTERRISLECV